MRSQRRKGWHREDIKGALRKKHGPLYKLSSSWGYHPSTVTIALGTPGIATVERRIAADLGVPPHTLWPDRWSPEGRPLPRTPNPSANRAPGQRQKREDI
ncbi:MAG: helix-turn-helix domain-containing protein [Rhodobacter sp.]|jgi:Ner family transcriptional regulator|uniref:helix-turn-helix domain-containing protein n=1 Tax=Phenylobacterium sp. TaxID=1871053 RepID=UPI0026012B71|nr:helix-turn-helix domain-containing protein [Phenylobacterium sp.]MCA3519357.1 helix-turn-helix domain-containing protein [Rhodobacter sp.]MCA6267085.1 helix-turn-helix domain-containing protein [Phenylobacterium sp.]